MRRFGDLMILLIGLTALFFSCKSKKEKKGYFIIGENRKEVIQENTSNNKPAPPPIPPMNYYPYVNILLTENECYVHFDNSRIYPSCGTGIDFSYVRRLNLKEEQIILLKNIDSTLNKITSVSPDKMIIDIASETDTIKNPLFHTVVQSLNMQGYDAIRVRNFTEEERCVLNKKLNKIPFNIDSIDWNKRPKIDALFDMDNDGSFEMHESLN
jgi:hypothetical protein